MASIVYRSVKGSPLTPAEIDSNFNNLNLDKIEKWLNVITDSSTSRTLAFTDNNAFIRFTSNDPITITVPQAFDGAIVAIQKVGAGDITFVEGSGVTIQSDSLVHDIDRGIATLVPVSEDVWDLNLPIASSGSLDVLLQAIEDLTPTSGNMLRFESGTYVLKTPEQVAVILDEFISAAEDAEIITLSHDGEGDDPTVGDTVIATIQEGWSVEGNWTADGTPIDGADDPAGYELTSSEAGTVVTWEPDGDGWKYIPEGLNVIGGGAGDYIISLNTTGDFEGDYVGIQDTYIADFPDTPNGSASILMTRSNELATLLAFDLGDLPEGLEVTAYELGLYLITPDGTPAGLRFAPVNRVFDPVHATWTYYAESVSWTTSGANHVPDDVAVAPSNTDRGDDDYSSDPGWVTRSGNSVMLGDVQAAYSTGGVLRWRIRQEGGGYPQFRSSRGTDGQRPYLKVTLSDPV